MLSRQHVQEIRRRGSNKSERRRLNATIPVELPLKTSCERHLLDCSTAVARHIRQIGCNSINKPRITLPLHPIGGKWSKTAHRTTLPKAPGVMQDRQENRPVKSKISDSFADGKQPSTYADLDMEEFHSMYLPEWLLERVRPLWSGFEKPAPALTNRNQTGSKHTPKYTFKEARERLRKEKEKANVDIDELFSNLGLDTSEVALTAPIKWPIRLEAKEPKQDTKYIEKSVPTRNLSSSPKESQHASYSPLKKRTRKASEFRDRSVLFPIQTGRPVVRASNSVTKKPTHRVTSMEQKRSISSDQPSSGNPDQSNLMSRGMDLFALKLHSDVPPKKQSRDIRNNSFSSVEPNRDDRVPPKVSKFPLAGPSFVTETRPWSNLVSSFILGNSHNQQRLKTYPEGMQRLDRLSVTFHESWPDRTRENLWISPPERLLNDVQFEKKISEIPGKIVRPFRALISSENGKGKPEAPDHPMWDTPEDLKTSYFSVFYIS